jgi:alpha-N-arabinofuranosidase
MRRREFLATAIASAVLAPLGPRTSRAADAQVDILLDEPIAPIDPNLHGHFAEHIGGVIYDGIWVGEDSPVPNVGGIRKALVDALAKLRPPVVRWPGGCFADSYDWRDGVGPRSKRPCRTNFWLNDRFLAAAPDGPAKYEPNEFGTDEFIRFCRLIGAEPYIAANVRGLTALDFDHWVEYCNSPAGTTTLAALRAQNGSREPYNVRFWGVGNESWGCGGNFTPEEYATEFRRFTAWVPKYGAKLRLIGSGPNGGDFQWTRGFLNALTSQDKRALDTLFGWALHYYCGTTGKGQAVDFTVEDWYALLKQADLMESLIERHWSVMGEVDTKHKTKLVVDEWGAWHKAGTEVDQSFLFGQMPTMRDALVTALTLDIFHRHADKLAMANVAQLINNLHCLFLAHGDRFVTTPNFHVFEMYKAHQGGQAVRMWVGASPIQFHSERGDASLWGLAGSASVQNRKLVVTLVNPHVKEERNVEINLRGASVRNCTVCSLASADIHAHNTFEDPNAVTPQETTLTVRDKIVWTCKPASVNKLECGLG